MNYRETLIDARMKLGDRTIGPVQAYIIVGSKLNEAFPWTEIDMGDGIKQMVRVRNIQSEEEAVALEEIEKWMVYLRDIYFREFADDGRFVGGVDGNCGRGPGD